MILQAYDVDISAKARKRRGRRKHKLKAVSRTMTKKQVALLSLVAAIPAGALIFFLIMGLLDMISDGSTVSAVLWGVWGLTMGGSLVMGLMPVGIMLYMKDAATAVAPQNQRTNEAPVADDEDEAADDDEESSEDSEDSGGEKLFDEGDMDDDFEEFEDFAEEEEK